MPPSPQLDRLAIDTVLRKYGFTAENVCARALALLEDRVQESQGAAR